MTRNGPICKHADGTERVILKPVEPWWFSRHAVSFPSSMAPNPPDWSLRKTVEIRVCPKCRKAVRHAIAEGWTDEIVLICFHADNSPRCEIRTSKEKG